MLEGSGSLRGRIQPAIIFGRQIQQPSFRELIGLFSKAAAALCLLFEKFTVHQVGLKMIHDPMFKLTATEVRAKPAAKAELIRAGGPSLDDGDHAWLQMSKSRARGAIAAIGVANGRQRTQPCP